MSARCDTHVRSTCELPLNASGPECRELLNKKLFAVSGNGEESAAVMQTADDAYLLKHSRAGEIELETRRGIVPRIVAVTPSSTKLWLAPAAGNPGLYAVTSKESFELQPLDELHGIMRTPRAFVPWGRVSDDPKGKVRYIFTKGTFVVDEGAPVIATMDGALLSVEELAGTLWLQHFHVASPRSEACESEIINTMPLDLPGAERVWPILTKPFAGSGTDYAFVYMTRQEDGAAGFLWLEGDTQPLPGELERVWVSPAGFGFCALSVLGSQSGAPYRTLAHNGQAFARGRIRSVTDLAWSPSGLVPGAIVRIRTDAGVLSQVVTPREQLDFDEAAVRELVVSDQGDPIGYIREDASGMDQPVIYGLRREPADVVWNLHWSERRGAVVYNRFDARTGTVSLVRVRPR